MPTDALLDVLTRFTRTLLGGYDVSEVLYELSDRAVEVLDADAAGVSLADDDGQLRFVTATNEAAEGMEKAEQDHDEGPCRRAFETGEVMVVPDIDVRTDWPDYLAAAHAAGVRSVAGIPMHDRGRRLGALNIYGFDVRNWTESDTTVAQILADVATIYVVHASELDQARRVNDQLERALTSRVLIEQAKGILVGERHCTMDQAFAMLRQQARNHNASVHSIAEGVVNLGLRP